MAIINCKECNTPISDKAKVCPHCGVPMRNRKGLGFAITSLIMGIYSGLYTYTIVGVNVEEISKKDKSSVIPIVALMIVLAIIFGLLAIKKSPKNKLAISGIILGSVSTLMLIIYMMLN